MGLLVAPARRGGAPDRRAARRSGAADLGATGIAALDEWLGCAELLRAQHPETLERLGFPDGQRAALRAAIAAAPATARALEPAPGDLLTPS